MAFLILWIVIALVAAIGEMLTTGLFLAALAVAALLTGLTAPVLPLAFQVLVFAVLSITGLAVFRPIAVHALGLDADRALEHFDVSNHIVGKRAVVTETVESDRGQIRIGGGEFWSARPYNPDDVIPAGRQVEVLLVENLTALVAPEEAATALPVDIESHS